MNTCTRRTTLKTAAAGLVAPLALATGKMIQAAPEKPPAVPEKNGMIDAHSHIWTRNVREFPLKSGTTVEDLAPPSFTAEELLKIANPLGIDRVVLIAHHTYYGFDNGYLIHAAEEFPGTFKVVGMIDETGPDPARKMRELQKRHVTGFRITPWIRENHWLDSPGMQTMWKTAADTGQAICCLIDAKNLEEVDQACERFPETRVVIDHFARIGVDGNIRESDVAKLVRLARHDHTFVKISAYYALGKKAAPYDDLVPMIRQVYEAFGPERLMWASDAPYQVVNGHRYAPSLNLIRERIDFLSGADKDWILRKTAQKVYYEQ